MVLAAVGASSRYVLRSIRMSLEECELQGEEKDRETQIPASTMFHGSPHLPKQVLSAPDFVKRFFVATDALDWGTGTVFLQDWMGTKGLNTLRYTSAGS